MGWKRWKAAEVQVALLLGGVRRIRINYSDSIEDVSHPIYAVEVKQGKQVPVWVAEIREPVILNDLVVLFPLPSLSSRSFEEAKTMRKPKIGFIIDGMCQAYSYCTAKRPILCMKRPRQQGVVACMYVLDYMNSQFMC